MSPEDSKLCNPPLSRAEQLDRRSAPFFAREQLTDTLILEIGPLLRAHYHEIAHYQDIELDVDWAQYYMIQANQAMRVFTARAEDHLLVGYAVFFVRHNPHYRRSLQAVNDVIFIQKDRRGFGKSFIVWCDEQLKAEGVQVVMHHVKAAHDWTPVLARMGYDFQDKIMTRRLDR